MMRVSPMVPCLVCCLFLGGWLVAEKQININGLAPQFEVTLNISPVEMLTGGTRDFFYNSLSPKADRFQLINYGGEIRFFLNRRFGLMLGYDLPTHGTMVVANYANTGLFYQDNWRVGLVLRFPFLVNPDGNGYHALRLQGGLLLSSFTFDAQYLKIASDANVSLSKNTSSGVGWFAQVDYSIRLGSHAQASVGVRFDGAENGFPGTAGVMKNYQVSFPLQFGLVFGDLITAENRLPEISKDPRRP